MQQNEIKNVLRDFIIENFLAFAEDKTFADTDSFMEKGIINSTGVLELLQYLEETFEIVVEDDEVIPENLDTLNNLNAFITKKSADSGTAGE